MRAIFYQRKRRSSKMSKLDIEEAKSRVGAVKADISAIQHDKNYLVGGKPASQSKTIRNLFYSSIAWVSGIIAANIPQIQQVLIDILPVYLDPFAGVIINIVTIALGLLFNKRAKDGRYEATERVY